MTPVLQQVRCPAAVRAWNGRCAASMRVLGVQAWVRRIYMHVTALEHIGGVMRAAIRF